MKLNSITNEVHIETFNINVNDNEYRAEINFSKVWHTTYNITYTYLGKYNYDYEASLKL